MKYKLVAVYERWDGTLLRQCVRHLTEEESVDNQLIHRLIRDYSKSLGEGYYLIDYYFGYQEVNMAKEYKYRVVSITLPKELDDFLNEIVDNLKKDGVKITKSKFITRVLIGFCSTIDEDENTNSKA